MTANNRQSPDHAHNDSGASQMSTSRSQRIDEVLRTKIESAEKFSFEDMQSLQQDVHDVNARKLKPFILDLVAQIKHEFNGD